MLGKGGVGGSPSLFRWRRKHFASHLEHGVGQAVDLLGDFKPPVRCVRIRFNSRHPVALLCPFDSREMDIPFENLKREDVAECEGVMLFHAFILTSKSQK